MSVLCYIVMKSNVPFLLSSLSFIRAFSHTAINIKAFVDVCVAVKYIYNIAALLRPYHPVTPSDMDDNSGGSSVASSKASVSSSALKVDISVADLSADLSGVTTPTSGDCSPTRTVPMTQQKVFSTLTSMGFNASDIEVGISIALARSSAPISAVQVIELLTTLDTLRDMGYERSVCVKALARVGNDTQAAVHFIKANNLETP